MIWANVVGDFSLIGEVNALYEIFNFGPCLNFVTRENLHWSCWKLATFQAELFSRRHISL